MTPNMGTNALFKLPSLVIAAQLNATT